MAQEVCRILDKSGHNPRDLGSCKVLTGKIQEASGMRLGFEEVLIYYRRPEPFSESTQD